MGKPKKPHVLQYSLAFYFEAAPKPAAGQVDSKAGKEKTR